jgi:hypothetical protein
MRESWQRAVARAEGDGTGARERMAARDRGIVAALVAAEIPLLVSTEAYAGGVALWGASVHDEMRELVNAGASPGIALRAATLEPARALGRDRELGRVAAGYRADLDRWRARPGPWFGRGPRQDHRATPRQPAVRGVVHAGPGATYGPLVAYATTPDLDSAVFATQKATRKYRLLSECAHVALVIDNRSALPVN